MERRECLLMLTWVALVGCGSSPEVKGEPPVPKAPAIAQAETSKGPASETYLVKVETTAGDFVVEVHPDWAPKGADRFREMVEKGLLEDCRFFRVIKDFMVQFGINGDPAVAREWKNKTIKDDPVKKSNKRGYITFATSGKDSRTTQVFINYVDNRRLDDMGFAPFGQVIEGMDVVDKLNGKYGGDPSNDQPQIQSQGNKFLDSKYPGLDSIKKASIIDKK